MAKAAERELDKTLRGMAERLGPARPVGDPLTALTELAGQAVRWRDFLEERVTALEALRYESTIGTEQIRGEVQLYQQALRDTRDTLATIAKLNIDERLARIDELTARMIIKAIDEALKSAGVTGPAATTARQVAARHLRVLPGGKAA
jgi:hypothetical protein